MVTTSAMTYRSILFNYAKKRKAIPVQALKVPGLQDNRYMKVVRLSALRTGRLYPPGNIPGTYFC